MKNSRVSSSMEDYLEAIALLTETHGHAHAADVARFLDVKMPSVTNALKLLTRHGYLEYLPGQPVLLTAEGLLLANGVIRKHRNLRRFLQNVLCLPYDKANPLACRIEHEIDEDTVQAIQVLSDAIEGRPDCRGLRQYQREALHGRYAAFRKPADHRKHAEPAPAPKTERIENE